MRGCGVRISASSPNAALLLIVCASRRSALFASSPVFPNNPHASLVSSRLFYLAPDPYILIPLGSCGLTGICGEAINLGVVGMAGLFGAECAQRTGGADRVFCGEVFVDAG